MYLYLLIGGIHVIATPNNAQIGFVEAGFSEELYYAWNVLIIGSPLMVAAAWALSHHRRGGCRVLGFWFRLGGDLGVLAALVALIATRYIVLRGNIGDSPIFALIMLAGFSALVATWVVRDIGVIILLEKTARQLHRAESGDQI
jgi:hypothetical protein